MLNLQIPSPEHLDLKRSLQTAKARLWGESLPLNDEQTADRTLRDKNALLAKVTALQHRVHAVKKTNRGLRSNLSRIKSLERQVLEVHRENELLKNGHLSEGTLQESMQAFRTALSHFLTNY